MAVIVMHGDTEIAYDESDDSWKFTLRGRDRSAPSLAKAREFIDKPLPPEKAKPFEKIPAWFFRYNDEPKRVEVIGIAEGARYSAREKVWLNCKGNRSKESVAFAVYPSNAKNDPLVAEILTTRKEIQDLREKEDKLKRKLAPLVLPKEE